MKFKDFINYAKGFVKKVNTAAEKPFQKETSLVLQDLQKRSPVDTGTYRDSWKVKEGSKTFGVLRSAVFYNDDPKFALMEFGDEPDTPPWYYPGVKRKRSGKLTVADGRVWAGGLDPGHSLTVGGAIQPVIEKYRKADVGRNISEVVLRRL